MPETARLGLVVFPRISVLVHQVNDAYPETCPTTTRTMNCIYMLTPQYRGDCCEKLLSMTNMSIMPSNRTEIRELPDIPLQISAFLYNVRSAGI